MRQWRKRRSAEQRNGSITSARAQSGRHTAESAFVGAALLAVSVLIKRKWRAKRTEEQRQRCREYRPIALESA
jgi:hypothetical protein